MHTVYQISADDQDVVEEFNAKPIGHHSPALQRVLNVIRGQPVRDKYVLICTKPHKEWTLGQEQFSARGPRGFPHNTHCRPGHTPDLPGRPSLLQ